MAAGRHRKDGQRGAPTAEVLSPAREEALNRAVKSAERVQLLKFVVPLVAAGIGVGWLYLGFGAELHRYWAGSAMAFAGSGLGVIGGIGRWRETRGSTNPTTRHYPLLFAAWALVAAGAIIPPYTSG